MDLSEHAERSLEISKQLIEECVARGCDLRTARLLIAQHWESQADDVIVSIRLPGGGEIHLGSARGKLLGEYPNLGAISGRLKAARIADWRAVCGILRLRLAIVDLGQDARPDGIIRQAMMSRNRAWPLLKWLELQGEYHGFAYSIPPRSPK